MAPYHPDRNHAQLHLPPLNPDEAVLLASIFSRLESAIWRAHGNAMADFLGRTQPDSTPRPQGAVWTNDRDSGDSG